MKLQKSLKRKGLLSLALKSLEPDIESHSIATEEKSDLSLLAEANSFSHAVCKKKELISALEYAL